MKIPVRVEMLKNRLFDLTILIVLAICLAQPIDAHADEPPIPFDYLQQVGEKYVFVMLSLDDPSHWGPDIYDEDIRSKYGQSGLYTSGEMPILIWTVDWYASQVEVSTDGAYLIRWELMSSYSKLTDIAFTVFKNGLKIDEYSFDQFVLLTAMPPSAFEWIQDSSFDQEKKILWIKTFSGQEYSIDITTGKIAKRMSPTAKTALFVIGGVLFMMSAVYIARSVRKNIESQKGK